MDNPEWVNRVKPPTITITATNKQPENSQKTTPLSPTDFISTKVRPTRLDSNISNDNINNIRRIESYIQGVCMTTPIPFSEESITFPL